MLMCQLCLALYKFLVSIVSNLIIKYSLFEFNDQKMKCGPLCFMHTTKGLLESNILHFLISKLIL